MAFILILDAFDFFDQALTERFCFFTQGPIAESFELFLQRINLLYDIGGLFDFTFIGVTPKDFDKFLEHGKIPFGGIIAWAGEGYY